MKAARRVLRGAGHSNVAGLPDDCFAATQEAPSEDRAPCEGELLGSMRSGVVGYGRWHARLCRRRELLRRLGRTDEAREAFERALALACSARERRFLEWRIAEL